MEEFPGRARWPTAPNSVIQTPRRRGPRRPTNAIQFRAGRDVVPGHVSEVTFYQAERLRRQFGEQAQVSCHLIGFFYLLYGVMISTDVTSAMEHTDTELVTQSLTGNREAFGQIVGQYQSLICSLAYSATGSLTQSEDLAQETFVIAWKQLRQLREPAKLRSWLCSIARSVISSATRRQTREPVHDAETLDIAHETPAPDPLPSERAINREEEAILWRSLEQIPELYREPLILFYREHQSVESVAAELELSEDAVKQRLSRGRKLLTEEVTAFVEGTLVRTNPGEAFTLSVLAALPAMTVSAKAATVGAAAKGAGLMGDRKSVV